MQSVSFDDIVPDQPHQGPPDRYVLEEGDGDATYCLQVHDRKQEPGQEMLGPNFTEAEAGIILFALNAVAEGDTLYRVHDPHNDVLTRYDGPTEGVRA
jgi:hypothetical protein